MKKGNNMVDTIASDYWRLMGVEFRGKVTLTEFHLPLLGLLYLRKRKRLPADINLNERFLVKTEVFGLEDQNINNLLKPIEDFAASGSDYNMLICRSMQLLQGYVIKNTEFGELADKLIELFLITNQSNLGTQIAPKEVVQLMLSYLSLNKPIQIYNPFGGLSSFRIHDNSASHYVIDEINPNTAIVSQLRLLLHDKADGAVLRVTDSFDQLETAEKKFDAIVSIPPFGMKLGKKEAYSQLGYRTESLMIEKSLDLLDDNGLCIIAVLNSYLTAGGKVQNFRKRLVNQNLLEAVITLPSRLLYPLSSLSFSILVINKNKSDDSVRFIDATELSLKADKGNSLLDVKKIQALKETQNREFHQLASNQLIKKNNFDLSVGRYFVDVVVENKDRELLIPLDRVLEFRSATKLKEPRKGALVNIKDLSDDFLNSKRDFDELKKVNMRPNFQAISKPALLVSSVGNRLNPTYYTGEDAIFLNPNIHHFYLKQNAKIDIEYLNIELRSEYVLNQLKNLHKGAAIPRISRRQFLEILIELPNLKEQRERVSEFKTSMVEEAKAKYETVQNEIGIEVADANSYLTHQIAGPLKNLRSSFTAITKIIDEFNKDCIDELMEKKTTLKSRLKFNDHLQIMKRDIFSITQLVRDSKEIESDSDYSFKSIDILSFIQQYHSEVEERESTNGIKVEFDLDFDLINVRYKAIYVKADPKKLRHALDNLIENAISHGLDKFEGKKILEIVLFVSEEDKSVWIEVSNSGRPLPNKFTIEDFVRRGVKGSDSNGTGFGGSYINEIVKRHNGKLDLMRHEAEEFQDFVTSFTIDLPVENFDYE